MNAKLETTCLWVMSLLLFCSGCTPGSRQLIGNQVTSAPVAMLQSGGPHADSWQTFDITINYQYKYDGDHFSISGDARLSQHYAIMYSWLRDLKVYLFFLDGDSRVLESTMVARSLTGQIDEALHFDRFCKLPPGTTRISFGYDGLVSEHRDYHSFYLLPLN
jgi:hypothetical protein